MQRLICYLDNVNLYEQKLQERIEGENQTDLVGRGEQKIEKLLGKGEEEGTTTRINGAGENKEFSEFGRCFVRKTSESKYVRRSEKTIGNPALGHCQPATRQD
jgi:hypothetical protein